MSEAVKQAPATILVVDDSVLVRQQVSRALNAAQFETVVAIDGVEALEKLEAHHISLIISDVNMPRMGGIELLNELKERRSAVPVIMLTTEGQETLVAQAKRAGAVAWILKPFKPELLVQAVQKLTSSPVRANAER